MTIKPADTQQKRMQRLRYGRIDVDRLTELTVDYCEKRKINPNHRMCDELAEMIVVIAEKILGGGQYRGYTEDWKQEMTSLAYLHVMLYIRNFDLAKSKASGKPDAAFSYYARIVANAFKQQLKAMKKHNERNPTYIETMEYDRDMMDQGGSAYGDYSYPDIARLDYGGLLS